MSAYSFADVMRAFPEFSSPYGKAREEARAGTAAMRRAVAEGL